MRPIDSSSPLDAGAAMAPDLAPLVPAPSAPNPPSAEQLLDTADPAAGARKHLEQSLEISYFKGQLGHAQPTPPPGVLYDNPRGDAGVPATETKQNKIPNDAPTEAVPQPGNGSAAGAAADQKASGVTSQPDVTVQLPLPDANLRKPSETEVRKLDHELTAVRTNFQTASQNLEKAKQDMKDKEAQHDAAFKKAYGGAGTTKDVEALNKAQKELDKARQAVPDLEKKVDDAGKKVDGKLQEIIKAYGIQPDDMPNLHFDPTLDDVKPTDLADTSGTSTSIGANALSRGAEFVADTALHESDHVRRNKELAGLHIDESKFPENSKVLGIYKELSEVESYRLEIKNASKLGSNAKTVHDAALGLRDHLKALKDNGGGDFIKLLTGGDAATLDLDNTKPEDLAKLIKDDKFDQAFQKFRDGIQLNPQSDKYEFKK